RGNDSRSDSAEKPVAHRRTHPRLGPAERLLPVRRDPSRPSLLGPPEGCGVQERRRAACVESPGPAHHDRRHRRGLARVAPRASSRQRDRLRSRRSRGADLARRRGDAGWISAVIGSPRFYSLVFDRPRLEIRRDEGGRFYVAGIELHAEQAGDTGIARWVLSQREIVIRDASVSWDDKQRGAPLLELPGFNFVLRNG